MASFIVGHTWYRTREYLDVGAFLDSFKDKVLKVGMPQISTRQFWGLSLVFCLPEDEVKVSGVL